MTNENPINLKVSSKKGSKEPLKNGIHEALLKAISKKDDKTFKIDLEVVGQSTTVTLPFEVASAWEMGSQLMRVAETVLGRAVNGPEIQDFDLQSLFGKACKVVIDTKRTSGGKFKPVITSVLPASN